MEIRPYSDDDLENVLSLWRAVSLATYTFLAPHTEAEDRAYFCRVIAQENELWIAADDRGVAGYLAIQGNLVDRLYVAVEHQGEGVGTALLNHAKRSSPRGLRLFTHQKNKAACRFYERRGFVVSKLGVSPPPECEPDVEYHWNLERSGT